MRFWMCIKRCYQISVWQNFNKSRSVRGKGAGTSYKESIENYIEFVSAGRNIGGKILIF